MTADTNHYDVLGVPTNATPRQIRAAFRKHARRLHPDKNVGSEAGNDLAEKFVKVKTAYDVLSDPDKRRHYDEQVLRPERGVQEVYVGPQLVVVDVPCTLEVLFTGGSVDAPVQIDIARVSTAASLFFGDVRVVRGRRRLHATAQVDVPAGSRDGQLLRRCRADELFGNGFADAPVLDFVCHALPHERFVRDGDDLVSRATVPLVDALAGGEVEVPGIDGTKVKVPLGPHVAPPGSVRVAEGHGMPRASGDGRGDLKVLIDVAFPTKLTPAQRVGLRLWAKL